MDLWEECKKYSFNFVSKNYCDSTSTSSKFKGKINLLFSKNENFVLHWEIEFIELWIDLFTTPSWLEQENSNFHYRKDLFDYLNIKCDKEYKQEKRPNRSSNKLIKLENKELMIANEWFNSEHYQSTIKNITSIIKGNNVAGSAKNPKNAEMVWDIELNISETKGQYNQYKYNLIMLLDDLFLFERDYSKIKKDDVEKFKFYVTDSNIDEWVAKIFNIEIEDDIGPLKKEIKRYIEFINSSIQNKNDIIKNFNKLIKQQMNVTKVLSENARKEIKNERNKVSKIKVSVFEGSNASENAHIYQIKDINNDIEKEIEKMVAFFKSKNNKYAGIKSNVFKVYHSEIEQQYKDIVNKYKVFVTDKENLLNLTSTVHRLFDKNYFTYSESGEQIILRNNILKNDLDVLYLYKNIPIHCLSSKRKEYLKLRRLHIS
ncbi:MAG4270 family putative restriction endonuclease [Mycoplasma sp. 2575]